LRRTPTILIALTLLASACGDDGGEEPTDALDADAQGDADDTDDADDVDADDVDPDDVDAEDLGGDPDDLVITFWHGLGGDDEVYIQEELAAVYSEQTDGVVVNAQNRGTYEEVLDQAITAAGTDQAPHIAQLYEIGTQIARDSGIFAPIHELDVDGVIDPDDYIEAVSSYYTDETGGLYSAPFNSSNPIMYLNREVFEEAGLDPDDPPQRFGEVMEACEEILAAEVVEGCFGMPIHAWFFEQMVANQGGLLASNDNGRDGRADEVLLDSDEAVAVMSWWQEMDAEGYWVNSGAREDWDDPRTLMANGQIAMAVDSTAAVRAYSDSLEEAGSELGTAFLPIPDDAERNGTIIGGASLYVLQDHPDEEIAAAMEFISWLSEPEQDMAWHQATGYFPVRSDSRDQLEQEGWFDENPNFATAVEQLEQTEVSAATQGAVMGQFPQIRSIVLDAAEAALFEGADPAEALAVSKQDADSVLQEYNADMD
jgi:sn-glycerol 3-phosphate transport system substrate-binding protein